MDGVILVDGKTFKCPSKLRWKKSDISAKDAGRTDDKTMHKNRIGMSRTLSLGWSNLTKQEIHEILVAFNPEYVNVTYWDPLDGSDTTRSFYTGDMEADVKWWAKGRERYSSLNFDIIERYG
ncbi:MAG: hypothetical protein Q4D16_19575 [Eubacteriales bacterium]|nr:hypothetical protein [Eubacteriales bacterium]